MELLRDRQDCLPDDVSVASTIGVFDGVHLGHQEVFRQVCSVADRLGVASAAVTFNGHPAHVVRPESAPLLLTTLDQKLELLEAQGLDYAYVISFDEGRAATSPQMFMQEVFVDSLHAKAIVVGEDFHFGAGRSGNVDGLTAFGEDAGFEVHALELIRHSDEAREPVSSTKIRRALAGGDVGRAAAMLGRPFEVRGVVEVGDRRGTQIGFPTANIPVPKVMAWPADAVYAGWCRRENGEVYPCAINIGRRPTFYEHAEQSLLEAHLIGFEGDLYGEQVGVSFVGFLRSERKFNGIDQLIKQLKADVDEARKLVTGSEWKPAS
ncbi:MAG: bifunctional riboflavin kinase/FAD synthetase [Acidimicrobiales bacterium]|nr:bifunctional riboflavin kinase/FAD synthetase [Acidimicrobiales bacterium]